ncbi:phospholipase D family protein [Pseudoxanthomonas dokdonensis]|uniref:PLD phosphodiesterase domain-containing protein n=1 Tax=Pseudoxanthomonas dokdonensis TaxID=344882 RepID=A0A0R0CKC3_9GAMM|nr:phospholipase D family protein [Pseudoxanthomonas dokdonensis]KRG69979.1 hypothetical protein ABB29_06970 [Pseudoxanthomonas dokdonensis]
MHSRLFVLALVALLSACSQLPTRPEMPPATALPPASQGPLSEWTGPQEQAHAGQAGFRLVSNGVEAFALRARSARMAHDSLDIQTYIWHGDMTGLLLAQRALEAADRGVRVRILVDDMDARAKNRGFAALDAHPNIEVRMFNPFASRKGTWGKVSDLGTDFKRLNHRMHNKSWIADNRIALVGGRNLGDEYFGASEETNFVDLDLLMAGPVVGQISASFDRFWNAPSNYPIATLSPDDANAAALEKVRPQLLASIDAIRNSAYARAVQDDSGVQAWMDGSTELRWSDQWRFVSDDPMKLEMGDGDQRSNVAAALLPVLQSTQQRAHLISPYFVPGDRGTALLVDLAKSGRDVKILTNSLAANDVAAVHGGYSRYRPTLLEGGVQIWELKPLGEANDNFSLKGSSGSSLHTKALVIDERQIFVGSYNLDPRSTSLNSEQGVLVSDPQLAAQLEQIFQTQVSPAHAWKVEQVDGDLRWSDGSETFDKEPKASASRRMQAWLMKILPVQSQL